MDYLEEGLRKIARLQKRYAIYFVIGALLLTLVLGFGLKDLRVESDITKEWPQHLPVFQTNNEINDKLGNRESIFVLIKMTDESNVNSVIRDIRDPRVAVAMMDLQERIALEPIVTSVGSYASVFQEEPETIEEVINNLSAIPGTSEFLSADYTATIMVVQTDVGSSDEQINSITQLIEEHIASTAVPAGIELTITGNPPMRVVIFSLLKSDAVKTLIIASLLILLVLFLRERLASKALLVFFPLTLGVTWTMGMLGWLNIPLSVATVGLGAMILGLGVEYGVFVVERYNEERDKGLSQEESLENTVHGVGTAITGSGLTTIIGFGALSFSTLPMMQHLGQTLALGIAFSMLAALVANPSFIIFEEWFEHWYAHRQHTALTVRRKRHQRLKK